jgi:phosphate transport system protein
MHIVRSFDEDLKYLSGRIAAMGGLAERMVEESVSALVHADETLARKVVADDLLLDIAEREIDEKAIGIIARRQPLADDLREIIGAIRISADLERVGDLAKNNAKRVVAITAAQQPVRVVRGLEALAELALGQLKDVLDVYATRAVSTLASVRERDAQIDAVYTSLFRELLASMMEDARNITPCTHLLFCAKNLERIGDHATNVAETIYYAATAEQLPERSRQDKSHSVTLDVAARGGAPRRRGGLARRRRSARPAPLGRRLVGQPRVVAAIGAALADVVAAEVEVLGERIAVRPFAGALGELGQLQPPRDRHDDVLDRAQHLPGDRLGVELHLQRGGADRGGDGARRPGGRLGRPGARLLGARRRGGRPAAAGELETVDLADHRVAADAAELGRDLARAQPFRP